MSDRPPPIPKRTYPMSRQGLGNSTVNVLRPRPRMAFFRLRFKDPEGKEWNFPKGLPVRAEFGFGEFMEIREGQTVVSGSFSASLPKSSSKPVRCRIKCASKTSYYIVEKPGTNNCDLATRDTLAQLAKGGRRFFRLPEAFSLLTADWTVTGGSNATADLEHGWLRQDDATRDLGSSQQPFQLTLNPHWKFFRFVFFDRYYGPVPSSGEQRASHGSRIAIPQIELEGFRGDASAAGTSPDSHSNWTVGGDPKKLLQCLPWILQFKDDNGKRKALPKLNGTNTGLRFSTPLGTYIHSKSATDRVIAQIPSGDSRLDLGANRLRYYDLPVLWKSLNYWVRGRHLPNKNEHGKFFDELTAAEVEAAEQEGNPLEFSLDDMVLTDITEVPIPFEDTDRVALFHHSFRKAGGNISEIGFFDPGNDISDKGYPYSKDARAPRRNYIWRYPDWTRLVIAQGNLFDVFDQRTRNTGYVAGARAAVRWVDAVKDDGVPALDEFSPRPTLTGGAKNDSMAVQPFYELNYLANDAPPVPGAASYDTWTNPAIQGSPDESHRIGRVDVALLRCAHHAGNTESAVLLRYQRFTLEADRQDNKLKNNPQQQEAWIRTMATNVAARWNGTDASNHDRAWLLPRSSPPEIQIPVLTFLQYLDIDHAHVTIHPSNDQSVGYMDTIDGLSELYSGSPNGPGDEEDRQGHGLIAAHEMGHAGGLPDDYNPPFNDVFDFQCRQVPGAPFLWDEAAMMWRNREVRARYFWHHAEWLRTTGAFSAVEFKIRHGNTENDFQVPHYPDPKLGRNYVHWPVRMALRARGSGTGCFDSHLYFLGNDVFASSILPKLPGITGTDPFDGVLTALVRIYIEFNCTSALLKHPDNRRQFITAAHTMISGAVPMRVISLKRAGNGGPPDLKRCLLYLGERYLDNKDPSATAEEKKVAARSLTNAPFHVKVTVTERTDQQAQTIDNEWYKFVARQEKQQGHSLKDTELKTLANTWMPTVPFPKARPDGTIEVEVDMPGDYGDVNAPIPYQIEKGRLGIAVFRAFVHALGMSWDSKATNYFKNTASHEAVVKSVWKVGQVTIG